MSEHRPEVADVIREHGTGFLERYRPSKEQRRVLTDLGQCQTAVLGGHVMKCNQCGHILCLYNSCRNRHCPKCQGAARAAWLEAREQEVLDVDYFHIVFTLPHELAPLALQNSRTVYGMLFRAASETLLTLARDPKHLGARIGCLALLHTWGQNLLAHPHLHCVIPAGGISADGKRWVSCRDGFFLPVHLLSRMFRGKFLAMLLQAFEQNELVFHGQLTELHHPKAWEGWLEPLRNKHWLVYAKPPFGGPRQVLKYLARYTHRVAISNRRILFTHNGAVTFTWKDYANGNTRRTMTLGAHEFLRRFLLHVLPSRFVRIRYYGFLANRNRADNLHRARVLIAAQKPTASLSKPLPTKPRSTLPQVATTSSIYALSASRGGSSSFSASVIPPTTKPGASIPRDPSSAAKTADSAEPLTRLPAPAMPKRQCCPSLSVEATRSIPICTPPAPPHSSTGPTEPQ